MKYNSATELINRRNNLRELDWEKRINRFETKEARDDIWNAFNDLLGNWDFTLGRLFDYLLTKQVRSINKIMAINPPTMSGILAITNSIVDSEGNVEWRKEIEPFYTSMVLDFAYLQVGILLPDELKDNYVFSQEEQDRIERNRRRKPRQEIVASGFHPRRKRGQSIPINTNKYNRNAKAFIEQRMNLVLPEMSNTMKKNLNLALRKSLDEVNKLGLTGKKANDYIANGISKSLGKKNLGRAMNIARTEGTALANWGMNESAKGTGLILQKEWITRRDGLVRDAHMYMEGVRVDQNGDFNVQGYVMNYPGDSSNGAPAGLVCNCRCTTVFHEQRI